MDSEASSIECQLNVCAILDEDARSNNIISKNIEEVEFQIIAIDRTPNDDSLTENCAAMETKTVACNEHKANNSISFKSDFCVRQQLDECQIFLK